MKKVPAMVIRFQAATVIIATEFLKNANGTKEEGLQRLFTTFLEGWPGVGLLLLRVAVGVTVAIQGAAYLSDHFNPTPETWAVCSSAIACGALLLIGFLTPVASVLLGLGAIAVSLSWFPATIPNLLGAKSTIFFIVIMAAAIALLGPGAYSIDARLFGRREIIIPRTSRGPEE